MLGLDPGNRRTASGNRGQVEGVACCGEERFLSLVISTVTFLFLSGALCEKGPRAPRIVWERSADSQDELILPVANVTSATHGSTKPAPSKAALPAECVL